MKSPLHRKPNRKSQSPDRQKSPQKSGFHEAHKNHGQEDQPLFWDQQGFSNSPNRAISGSGQANGLIQRKEIGDIPAETATKIRIIKERRPVRASLSDIFDLKKRKALTPEIEALVKGNVQFGGVNEDMKPALTDYLKLLLYKDLNINMHGLDTNMSVTKVLRFSEDSPTRLGRYGKSSREKLKQDMVYRFTRFGSGNEQKILVEELGPLNEKKQTNSEKEIALKKFERYFSFDAGFPEDEKAMVAFAVARLPDGMLSKVAGIKFYRGGFDPKNASARYSEGPRERRITIYEEATYEDDTRYGDAQSGFRSTFEVALVHEIGHAIDNRPIFEAKSNFLDKVDNKNKEQRELYALKKKFARENIWDIGAEVWQKEQKLKAAEIFQDMAKERLEETFSHAGDGVVFNGNRIDPLDAKKQTKFRFAEDLDGGVPISIYGKVGGRNESFPEAFAAYYTDPERFKALRPYLYQYFEGGMHLE